VYYIFITRTSVDIGDACVPPGFDGLVSKNMGVLSKRYSVIKGHLLQMRRQHCCSPLAEYMLSWQSKE